MPERLERAEKLRQALQRCRQEMEYQFRDLYPVGTIVTVEIGRSRFRAEVLEHDHHETFHMRVKNLKTGSVREIGIGDLRD